VQARLWAEVLERGYYSVCLWTPKDSLAYDVLSQIVGSLVDQAETVPIMPNPQQEGACFSFAVHSEDVKSVNTPNPRSNLF
jgi:hypothetical protein